MDVTRLNHGAWQQWFKWAVSALLLVNFVLYDYQDLESAVRTLGAHASFLQWERAYLTTIDLTPGSCTS